MSQTIEIIADNLPYKTCTGIASKLDTSSAAIDAALDIVKDFIISRQLILFGGQAIDYALRLKGSFLYPSDVLPDYDFLSDNNVSDAYDLADILVARGFEKVDVIRGLHVQTMKVRISYIAVADVGFVPTNIYTNLPTFNYMGMRIISPTYQRGDMHIPMAFPFSNVPKENIFHRWKKDIKRLNMFQKFFPIEVDDSVISTKTLKCFTPYKLDSGDLAAHGFLAYAIIYETLETIVTTEGIPSNILKLKYSIDDTNVTVEYPNMDESDSFEHLPMFASHKVESFAKKGIAYKPFLDAIQELRVFNGGLYMNTKNELIGISKIKTKSGQIITTVSPHAVMVWLIAMTVRDKKNEMVYLKYYKSLFNIMSIAEQYYYSTINKTVGVAGHNETMKKILDEYLFSPFAPSLQTMGDRNIGSSYTIMNAMIINKFKDTPPSALMLPDNVGSYVEGLPNNYYTEKDSRPTLTKIDNDLFKKDGNKFYYN